MKTKEYTLRERIVGALIGIPIGLACLAVIYHAFGVDIRHLIVIAIIAPLITVWPAGPMLYRMLRKFGI